MTRDEMESKAEAYSFEVIPTNDLPAPWGDEERGLRRESVRCAKLAELLRDEFALKGEG